MKCKKCGQEIKENRIIKIEFEKEKYNLEVMRIEQKNIAFKDFKIPKGYRLPNMVEAFRIYDEKLEDFDNGNNDFWVEQPSEILRKKGNAARLGANSDRANLDCFRDPANSNTGLGAIFVKRVK